MLEGPQGTLYGRNSTTGLVNFIAAKPGAEQYLNIGAGQDGLSRFSFGRDFDISDTAMPVSYTHLTLPTKASG